MHSLQVREYRVFGPLRIVTVLMSQCLMRDVDRVRELENADRIRKRHSGHSARPMYRSEHVSLI